MVNNERVIASRTNYSTDRDYLDFDNDDTHDSDDDYWP